MVLSQEQANDIANALNQRKIYCTICKSSKLIVIDGYITHSLQNDPLKITIGGRILPMVAVVCDDCGHIMYFSMSSLGLMGAKKKNGEKEK